MSNERIKIALNGLNVWVCMIVIFIGALAMLQSGATNAGLPIATPAAQRLTVPWNLNTRCRIDSKNLPKRAEETV